MGTAVTLMMTGCGANTANLPTKPTEANCNDWDYDEKTGTYQCDDTHSNYRGHYFYGGSYYNTASALMASNAYKNGVTSGKIAPNQSTSKSGFGSGSKGGSFGG